MRNVVSGAVFATISANPDIGDYTFARVLDDLKSVVDDENHRPERQFAAISNIIEFVHKYNSKLMQWEILNEALSSKCLAIWKAKTDGWWSHKERLHYEKTIQRLSDYKLECSLL